MPGIVKVRSYNDKDNSSSTTPGMSGKYRLKNTRLPGREKHFESDAKSILKLKLFSSKVYFLVPNFYTFIVRLQVKCQLRFLGMHKIPSLSTENRSPKSPVRESDWFGRYVLILFHCVIRYLQPCLGSRVRNNPIPTLRWLSSDLGRIIWATSVEIFSKFFNAIRLRVKPDRVFHSESRSARFIRALPKQTAKRNTQ